MAPKNDIFNGLSFKPTGFFLFPIAVNSIFIHFRTKERAENAQSSINITR